MKARKLIAAKEAGEILGISAKMVYHWAEEGRIPREAVIILPGGQRRYIEEEIRRMAK